MEGSVILSYSIFNTSFGPCGIVLSEKGIIRLILPGLERYELISVITNQQSVVRKGNFKILENSIKRYFRGEKINFIFPLDLSCCTAFQQRVYKITKTIPYSKVKTYKWVAKKIGLPDASRAVGNALSKNPIPLLIPCHRVVKENGGIGGFTAPGGADLKRKMLRMEADFGP